MSLSSCKWILYDLFFGQESFINGWIEDVLRTQPITIHYLVIFDLKWDINKDDILGIGFSCVHGLPAEVMIAKAIIVSMFHKCVITTVQKKMRIPVKASFLEDCLANISSICVAIFFKAVFSPYNKIVMFWKNFLFYFGLFWHFFSPLNF